MAYCPSCGEEVESEAAFCGSCGSELAAEDADTPVHTDTATAEANPVDDSPTDSDSVLSRWNTNQRGVLVGGSIGGISAFLPWLSITVLGTSQTMHGIDGDGVFTLVAAVIAVLAAAYTWNRWVKVVVVLAGVVLAGLGLLYITDPTAGMDMSQFTVQQAQIIRNGLGPSIGIYGTLIGGAIMIGSVVLDYL